MTKIPQNIQHNVMIISLIALITFIFLWKSGTLDSGYHFQDDHEIIRIKSDLHSSSIYDVIRQWVKEDLGYRFRPMYFIHRILITHLFGSNFLLLSLYTGLLGTFTFISTFFGMKNLGFNNIESTLTLFITFIGPQSAIWWRLGPNETIGITFLGLSFLFMSRCLNKKRSYRLNNILFAFFLLLSSLCKESFLIIVPAFIVYKVFNEKNSLKISLKKSLQKNLISIVLILAFILEIYFIKSYVGLNKIGYAGIDLNLKSTMRGILGILNHLITPYFYILFLAFILLIIQKAISKHYSFKPLVLPAIFSILVVAPNLVLYAKSGMWERYFLPTSFGLAFLISSLTKEYGEGIRIMKVIIAIIIIFFYIPILKDTYSTAKSFTKEGLILKSLVSNTKTHYDRDTKSLIVVDPVKYYEQSISLKYYLNLEYDIDLFGYAFEDESLDEEFRDRLIKGWYNYFNEKRYTDLGVKPGEIIFLDSSLIGKFFSTSDLSITEYDDVNLGECEYKLLTMKENK